MSVTRLAALLAAALSLSACASLSPSEPVEMANPADRAGPAGEEREGDRAIGREDAPLLLIAYMSPACSHCADWHANVWDAVVQPYVDRGRLRVVQRPMHTGRRDLAVAEFMIADCLPEEDFFDAMAVFYDRLESLSRHRPADNTARAELAAIAGELGLSAPEFETCVRDLDRHADMLRAHDRSVEDGARGTPYFILNGAGLEAGAGGYVWNRSLLTFEERRVFDLKDASAFRSVLDHILAEHPRQPVAAR
jgi:hypothetical protein